VTATPNPDRPGSPEDILRRAAAVPDQAGFPALDDLLAGFEAVRAAHPGLVERRRVGTSRLGEPIDVYSIGQGSRSYLVVGGIHPNEPVGSWTALHLLTELATDDAFRAAFGARWHIVASIDPDGYRLNEGWFAHPTDRIHYARHFYRPAADEQVEWTFPFAYKRAYFDRMLPETQALARLMDDVRPDYYVALHNAELGGVYYYVSREVPELTGLLHAVPAALGLPLATGEPESGDLTALAPAVYALSSLEAAYDWMEALGLDPVRPHAGGDSSTAYARRFGTFSLVAELPYWRHPDADDTTPAGESYAALLDRTGRAHEATGAFLEAVLAEAAPYLSIDGPLRRGAVAFAPTITETGQVARARAGQPEARRPATVAERFGCEDVVHMFRLRFGSMTLQALQAECAAGVAPAALRRLTARLAARFEEWAAQARAADRSEPIPIGRVVGVQYGAVLAGAALVAGRLGP
jgi:hypothetical protein